MPPPAPAAMPAMPGATPDCNNESLIPSFAYIRIAPLVALSTILACVPRQNARAPPSLYTLANAWAVDSERWRPMRVFHTSNGMPRDAASAIWIKGPMATSMMGMATGGTRARV